jgi:hypothetical protein
MRKRWLLLVVGFACVAGGIAVYRLLDREVLSNRLVADTGDAVTIFDASAPMPLEPTPQGWRHRKFWFVPPMKVSFTRKDGVPALRCETNAGGSILGRHTDIDVVRFRHLTWRWLIEVPIASDRDERTREGDDHPVRFFLEFRDTSNGAHRMEIIWANRAFKRGEWKYLGAFPHYVADGGNENMGHWREESADLLDIYRAISKRTDAPRLSFFALFCDSDNTGGRSVAYTSGVRLSVQ